MEKSVRLLQPIEIQNSLFCRPLHVLHVSRQAIRLRLERRNHVGIVNPKTCLVGIAFLPPIHALFVGHHIVPRRRIVFFRLFPLHVGVFEAERFGALVTGQNRDSERNRAEYGEIHMLELRLDVLFDSIERLERNHKPVLERLVAGETRTIERVRPQAHHGIVYGIAAAVSVVSPIAVFRLVAVWNG